MTDDDDYRLLLSLARGDLPEGRGAVFGEVGRILVDDIRDDQHRERALAADILLRLISEVETRLRWELATRIASRPDAPPALVVALASDDEIEVARPVLLESPLLSDRALLRIIHDKSEGHRLAIARRRAVSARVARGLVDTGDADTVVALLCNEGAELDRETLEILVEQSQWEVAYREPLVQRSELPRALARRLYGWVAKPLREAILRRFDIDRELLAEDIERIIQSELSEIDAAPRPAARVGAAAAGLAAERAASPESALAALEKGDTAYFEEIMAELCGLPQRTVRRLAYDRTAAGLVVLCNLAGFDDEAFAQICRFAGRCGDEPAEPEPDEIARLLRVYRETPEPLLRKIAFLRRNGRAAV